MRYLVSLFATLTVAPLWAQPSINASGVVNAASYASVGLPNSAIAQGSIFIVFGKNLGPVQLVQGTYPLPLTLSGTSAQVTMNGAIVSPIMVYTSAGQVAMLMPSATPAGSGTIAISYNGQASAPAAVQVVSSSFGMFSVNQGGTGPAVATDANYASISLTHAANPGQTLILWGTGLGKISSDETQPPSSGNVGAKPTVWVGSQQANVMYWGRSGCCSGLDQINFQAPMGITGCYVPVAVQTGNVVSNFGSIAVAGSGSVCSDPVGLSSAELAPSQNGQNLNVAMMGLLRSTVSSYPSAPAVSTSVTTDSGAASFLRYTPSQLNGSSFGQTVSAGGCMVFPAYGAATVIDPVQPLGLDAGGVTIGGSNGTKTLPASLSSKGVYSGTLGSSDGPPNLFLDPSAGPHTFNGFGGKDLGAFIQELSMPPAVTWVNQNSISTVSESQGVSIGWTSAAPGSYVRVMGYSFSLDQQGNPAAGASFSCTANAGPAGTGQFAIPPFVLLSLPQSTATSTATPSGFLGVSSQTARQSLPAIRGIDVGFAQASWQVLRNVVYAP